MEKDIMNWIEILCNRDEVVRSLKSLWSEKPQPSPLFHYLIKSLFCSFSLQTVRGCIFILFFLLPFNSNKNSHYNNQAY